MVGTIGSKSNLAYGWDGVWIAIGKGEDAQDGRTSDSDYKVEG